MRPPAVSEGGGGQSHTPAAGTVTVSEISLLPEEAGIRHATMCNVGEGRQWRLLFNYAGQQELRDGAPGLGVVFNSPDAGNRGRRAEADGVPAMPRINLGDGLHHSTRFLESLVAEDAHREMFRRRELVQHHAPQLFDYARAHHGHPLPHLAPVRISQLARRIHAGAFQHLCVGRAHPPDIADGRLLKHCRLICRVHEVEDAQVGTFAAAAFFFLLWVISAFGAKLATPAG